MEIDDGSYKMIFCNVHDLMLHLFGQFLVTVSLVIRSTESQLHIFYVPDVFVCL